MEQQQTIQQEDPGKTVAILSYCTLIGFIIALVMNSDQKNKSELGVFHIRQALGIFLTSIALMIVGTIFMFIPFIGWLISILIYLSYFGVFVFWILGLIAAVNSEQKAVPIVGNMFQTMFKGIS